MQAGTKTRDIVEVALRYVAVPAVTLYPLGFVGLGLQLWRDLFFPYTDFTAIWEAVSLISQRVVIRTGELIYLSLGRHPLGSGRRFFDRRLSTAAQARRLVRERRERGLTRVEPLLARLGAGGGAPGLEQRAHRRVERHRIPGSFHPILRRGRGFDGVDKDPAPRRLALPGTDSRVRRGRLCRLVRHRAKQPGPGPHRDQRRKGCHVRLLGSFRQNVRKAGGRPYVLARLQPRQPLRHPP